MDPTRTPHKPFLRIDKLTKRFDGLAAVDAVSIDIEQGEIFALLGSSGCGKSTLLRMLAGFETPTDGGIFLEGEDISRMPPHVRPINMMFQSYALFPHLTVTENVAFGLKRQGLPKDKVAARVDAMLTLVQLKPYVKRKPHQLSGGQQQRVALARSLALEPKLLLLDEPLGALDRKLREQTQFELKNIIKRVGVTCVMVTHDQEEAMTMADRIAVMSAGKFLQVGAPQDIYETPSNRFVADFIGNVNLFDGTLVEDQPDHCTIASAHGSFYIGHGVTGVEGMPMSVAVRPEKIELEPRDPAVALPPYNAFGGSVVERAYFGSSSLYRVQLASGMKLQVSVPNADRHGDLLEIGAEVIATITPQSIVVLAPLTQREDEPTWLKPPPMSVAERKQRRGRRFVIGTPYLFLLLFFSLPFLVVLRISLSDMEGIRFTDLLTYVNGVIELKVKLSNYIFLTSDPLYIETYWSSIKFAALNTAICLFIGYPFAYFMARSPTAWRPALLMLVSLPFWTSYLLRVYAWRGLLDDHGVINDLIIALHLHDGPVKMMYTSFSMMTGMVYTYVPFMILPLYSNLVKMDLRLLEAANDLGATPWKAFWLVTVPLSKSGIIAGSMLVFIPSLGEYVIPELLGGPSTLMIGRVLWDEFFSNNDWPMASAVAVSMVVLILIPLMIFNKYQNEAEGAAKGSKA